MCYGAAHILGQLSKEEQIYLQDYRNQLVHGYLRGKHNEFITIKYHKNGKLECEKLTAQEYHATIEIFAVNPMIDEILDQLMEKTLNQELGYWKMLKFFQVEHENLYKIMREGKTFKLFP